MPKTTKKKKPVQPPQKSIKNWITLIVAPFVALILVLMIQLTVHVATPNANGDTSPLLMTVNIMSVLIGIVSVVLLVLLPVWVIMLIKTIHQNQGQGLNKVVAIVLAVVFGGFAWLYTYEKDTAKFWVNLALSIVTFNIWGVVAWIWAIIDMATRPDEFFIEYPNYEA